MMPYIKATCHILNAYMQYFSCLVSRLVSSIHAKGVSYDVQLQMVT